MLCTNFQKKKAPQKGQNNSGKGKGKASGKPPVSLQDLPSYVPPPMIQWVARMGGHLPLAGLKFQKKTVSTQKSTAQRQSEASSSRGAGPSKQKKDGAPKKSEKAQGKQRAK
ncbi:hypothetical protein FOMPIDRAFT_1055172 [Fomitopsis schrenkii]|uniref:Uncharacterized protein n=1 Tax=Fomitopsis schrenkii TaxID=2126942 RepID=S8EXR8_FOMSC|nr:hypothetical protein FOMPIDRAFT_1055172 [Fomitopsis schrenkii]